MLSASPRRWLSWDYSVTDPEGAEVARVTIGSWREKGTVIMAEGEYRVYRQGLTGPFVLESIDGSTAASAVKPSALQRKFAVRSGDREYTLEAAGALSREFGLFDGDRRVGAVVPASWLSRRARADFDAEIPPPLQAFVLWLTLLMWKRSSDSSVAAG
jgi:hypothetical protein